MKQPRNEIDDCASVWFARLERARNLRDVRREREAVANLRRLGVIVSYRLPQAAAAKGVERGE